MLEGQPASQRAQGSGSRQQQLNRPVWSSSEAVLASTKAGILCKLNLPTQPAPAKASPSTCTPGKQAGRQRAMADHREERRSRLQCVCLLHTSTTS